MTKLEQAARQALGALAEGALRLEQLLQSSEGLTTGHVRAALQMAA